MNKKIITIIIVILISFCFLSIVVAENATHDNNNTTDHGKTPDKNKTIANKTNNESKNNYILAKEMETTLNLVMGLKDLDLIIQNPLQVQEMNSNVPLHQRPAIQIR